MKLKNLYREQLAVPILLFVLSVLSYAVLNPWLGFLQDDWYMMWHAHAFGPAVFVKFFSWERPGLAWIYQATTTVLGTAPITWQCFAVLCRWLVSLAFWWLLRLVWPRWTRQAAWIAVLFAVYPGFRSLHFSVMFSNLLMLLFLHLLSFCAMLLAVRQKKWYLYLALTLGGICLALFSMFSVEYFFGWELLRPIFLWIVLSGQGRLWRKDIIKPAILHWLPYVLAAASFLFWRVFIFKFPTKYQPVLFSDTLTNPSTTFLKTLRSILQDALDINLFAWERPLSLLKNIETQEVSILLALGLAAVVAAVTALWLFLHARGEPCTEPDADGSAGVRWAKAAVGVGLLSALLSGWPFWFVGIDISSDIGPDRFTLPFMMGACILLVGLMELCIRTRAQKFILIALLAGLAGGQHFQDANALRRIHEEQGRFFRQLTWRVPGLKAGTLLVTDKMPMLYSTDTSLTAPLNWIYDQQAPYSMQYAILELESRLGSTIPELKPGLPLIFGYRATKLTTSTSKMVVFNYSPPSCLRIIDPAQDVALTLSDLINAAASLSNLQQIEMNPSLPAKIPQGLFTEQDSTDWCYYYERADLARQSGEWKKVIELGEEAFKHGYAPAVEIEYLPFIEAYLHIQKLAQARQLTQQAWRGAPLITPILCATWEDPLLSAGFDGGDKVTAAKVTEQIGCKQAAGGKSSSSP